MQGDHGWRPAAVASGTAPVRRDDADDSVHGQARLAELREIVRRTREMVRHVDSVREAAILVRRSSVADRLVEEALKHCRLLEQEQFDLRQEAAEAHLRTQRRAGELLARMRKHAGGRPRATASTPEAASAAPPTLRELGIDVHESHRWQRIASLPAEVFEEFLASSRERRFELTTGVVLALATRTLREERDIADARLRPSGRPALQSQYDGLRRHACAMIWLDPVGLAAAMGPAQRAQARGDVERLLLWLTEFRDALDRRRAVAGAGA